MASASLNAAVPTSRIWPSWTANRFIRTPGTISRAAAVLSSDLGRNMLTNKIIDDFILFYSFERKEEMEKKKEKGFTLKDEAVERTVEISCT